MHWSQPQPSYTSSEVVRSIKGAPCMWNALHSQDFRVIRYLRPILQYGEEVDWPVKDFSLNKVI